MVVAAGLAQVGEFSFILVALGISLEEFSEEGRNLVLAASLASITLNPLIFRSLDVTERSIAGLGARLGPLERLLHPPMEVAIGENPAELDRHVIVCGYGAVGRELVAALERRQFAYAVIESDPYRFDELKRRNLRAVYGDASSPAALDACRVEQARIVAVTFPGPASARLVLNYAKERNPQIDVIVRGRSPDDYEALITAGADEVVHPEFEAGLEFVRHTLHRYGVDRTQIQALLGRRRRDFYGG
jgi:CPA2 family monovalent cation:H+ antiporter-2